MLPTLPMTPPDGGGGLYQPAPKDWSGITNPVRLLIDYTAGLGEDVLIGAIIVFAIAIVAAVFGHRARLGAFAVAILAGAILLANPAEVGNLLMGNTTA